MKVYEQVYNIVWMTIGILICIKSWELELWGVEGPGSGFLTFGMGLGIGVSGLVLLLTEKFNEYHKKIGDEFWGYPKRIKTSVYVISIFCIMAFLMPIFGYICVHNHVCHSYTDHR